MARKYFEKQPDLALEAAYLAQAAYIQAYNREPEYDGADVVAHFPGFWPAESAARGFAHAERAARFDDGIDGLRAAFGGEAHNGPHVHVPAGLAPGPFTDGGPPLWLAGAAATMRRALSRRLPFQASRVSPEGLAPLAREWHDAGGGLLGVRIRVGLADVVSRAEGVDWQALTGPPAFLADALGCYAQLGVSDVSLVPGQDDRSSRTTVEALVEQVLPALRSSL